MIPLHKQADVYGFYIKSDDFWIYDERRTMPPSKQLQC